MGFGTAAGGGAAAWPGEAGGSGAGPPPPPHPRRAQRKVEAAGRKAKKARKENEVFREMADKSWKGVGNLEEF